MVYLRWTADPGDALHKVPVKCGTTTTKSPRNIFRAPDFIFSVYFSFNYDGIDYDLFTPKW